MYVACSSSQPVLGLHIPSTPALAPLDHAGMLLVTAVLNPAAHTEADVLAALKAAQTDGRLAAALAGVGLQLAGVEVLSAAPGSNRRTMGGAIGGEFRGRESVVAGRMLPAVGVSCECCTARHSTETGLLCWHGLPQPTRSPTPSPVLASCRGNRRRCSGGSVSCSLPWGARGAGTPCCPHWRRGPHAHQQALR